MASLFSAAADAAWAKDSDWIVAILWRSEFRNALSGSIRRRSLTVEEAIAVANLADAMLDRKEFTVSTSAVLQLVSRSNSSAYNCEFVALTHANGVRLLTVDRQICTNFQRSPFPWTNSYETEPRVWIPVSSLAVRFDPRSSAGLVATKRGRL